MFVGQFVMCIDNRSSRDQLVAGGTYRVSQKRMDSVAVNGVNYLWNISRFIPPLEGELIPSGREYPL